MTDPCSHPDCVLVREDAEEQEPPKELPGCALCRAERDTARRTLRSISAMLGWVNTPPRETLERDIAALKARAAASPGVPPQEESK